MRYNNQGSSAVYSLEYFDGTSFDNYNVSNPAPMNKFSAMNWVCWPGSPCASMTPKKFLETPEYFFKLRVETRPPRADTLCNYRSEFVIRIHNLPLGYPLNIMINICKCITH
jgi:hypothetical protein